MNKCTLQVTLLKSPGWVVCTAECAESEFVIGRLRVQVPSRALHSLCSDEQILSIRAARSACRRSGPSACATRRSCASARAESLLPARRYASPLLSATGTGSDELSGSQSVTPHADRAGRALDGAGAAPGRAGDDVRANASRRGRRGPRRKGDREGHNTVRADLDPSAHGEIVAIRVACRSLGTWQLKSCELYTSCEPCLLCSFVIIKIGIRRVVFAARGTDVPTYRPLLGADLAEAADWVNAQPDWTPIEVVGDFMPIARARCWRPSPGPGRALARRGSRSSPPESRPVVRVAGLWRRGVGAGCPATGGVAPLPAP
jgi:Cytidine and deoxycytidylate deaminase zinc-binding region